MELEEDEGNPFFRSFEKEIYWKHTIHPTVRGRFSVRTGPNDGSTSATLNVLDPDIKDEPLRATHMQPTTGHENPGISQGPRNDQQINEVIKLGGDFRLEPIYTDQVAKVNQASTRSERSPIRWHTEVPANQGEGRGNAPHLAQKEATQQ